MLAKQPLDAKVPLQIVEGPLFDGAYENHPLHELEILPTIERLTSGRPFYGEITGLSRAGKTTVSESFDPKEVFYYPEFSHLPIERRREATEKGGTELFIRLMYAKWRNHREARKSWEDNSRLTICERGAFDAIAGLLARRYQALCPTVGYIPGAFELLEGNNVPYLRETRVVRNEYRQIYKLCKQDLHELDFLVIVDQGYDLARSIREGQGPPSEDVGDYMFVNRQMYSATKLGLHFSLIELIMATGQGVLVVDGRDPEHSERKILAYVHKLLEMQKQHLSGE